MALEEINDFSRNIFLELFQHLIVYKTLCGLNFLLVWFFLLSFFLIFELNVLPVYKPNISQCCLDLAELATVHFGSISSLTQLPPS